MQLVKVAACVHFPDVNQPRLEAYTLEYGHLDSAWLFVELADKYALAFLESPAVRELLFLLRCFCWRLGEKRFELGSRFSSEHQFRWSLPCGALDSNVLPNEKARP